MGLPPRPSSGRLIGVVIISAVLMIGLWTVGLLNATADRWAAVLLLGLLGVIADAGVAFHGGLAYSMGSVVFAAAAVINPTLTVAVLPVAAMAGEVVTLWVHNRSTGVPMNRGGVFVRSVANASHVSIVVAIEAGLVVLLGLTGGPDRPAEWILILGVVFLGECLTSVPAAVLSALATDSRINFRPFVDRANLTVKAVASVVGVVGVAMAAHHWWLPVLLILPVGWLIAAAKRSAEDISALSHDPPSGLLTRQAFLGEAQDITAPAVGVLQVRQFTDTLRALGQQAADDLWASLADLLHRELPNLHIARVGADSAAVCITADNASGVISRIAATVEAHTFTTAGVVVPVRVRIGLAERDPDATPSDLLLRAEAAADTSDRGAVALWAPTMQASADSMTLAAELPDAMAGGRVIAHYQPIVASDGVTVLGCEALARWDHPEQGLIPPFKWLGLVERMGMSGDLTAAMIESACRDLANWQAHGIHGITVNVNVDASDMVGDDLAGLVVAMAERHGVDPHAIALEVTEAAATSDAERTIATIEALHRVGVTVSIDDFGTGESSLARIADFEFDQMKLDRAFIMKLDHHRTAVTVQGLVKVGKALDMSVVAEGIEEVEVIPTLRGYGVDKFQGYGLGKPMPAADFLARMQTPRTVS